MENNLRMAKPQAAESELWAALEEVNLADFCRSQNGLQTAVHEGGSNLFRRAAAALLPWRALCCTIPPSTSSMKLPPMWTPRARTTSWRPSGVWRGKKTVILISHRLANVVDSDCIYVLENGGIAEHGTHAQLLAQGGAYCRLYTAQKQLETLAKEDA